MERDVTQAAGWTILDALSEGVLVLEADGVIVTMNGAAVRLLGLEQECRSLAEVYATIAPNEMWQHFLTGPSEADLYTPAGLMHLAARPYAEGERDLIQLTVNPVPSAGQVAVPDGVGAELLQALLRISQQLSATLGLENILQVLADEALRSTGSAGCRLRLAAQPEQPFQPYLTRGDVPGAVDPALERQVFDSQLATILNELPGLDGPRSALFAPILYEGQVAGLIELFGEQPGHFGEAMRLFAMAVANHAAIAIGNTRRLEALEGQNRLLHQRAQQIERFVESGRVFHADRPIDEVLEDLV
jgi:hypothetical protein